MEKKQKWLALVLPALLISVGGGTSALAEKQGRTVGESESIGRGIGDKAVAISPHLGIVEFNDATNDRTTRGVAGLTADWNAASLIGLDRVSIVPQTGIFFSHLGNPGSNLFGADSDANLGQAGSNLLLIPVNLKLAYNVSDRFRVGFHGGGNVTYRSTEQAVQLGTGGGGSDWAMFPNVGADVDFGLSENVALSLRPDWTLAGNDIFTGTVNLGFMFG
jgi:hypothetical protein